LKIETVRIIELETVTLASCAGNDDTLALVMPMTILIRMYPALVMPMTILIRMNPALVMPMTILIRMYPK